MAAMALLLLQACGTTDYGRTPNAVVVPALPGWYEAKAVRYIVTDVSNVDMARMMGANTAGRLGDVVPPANSPGARNALERVYKFASPAQPSVFPSIPNPLGPESRDKAYSPVWRVVEVRWQPGRAARELKSEEQVLATVERGDTTLTVTDIVINCPVIWVEGQALLPGTRLVYERSLDLH